MPLGEDSGHDMPDTVVKPPAPRYHVLAALAFVVASVAIGGYWFASEPIRSEAGEFLATMRHAGRPPVTQVETPQSPAPLGTADRAPAGLHDGAVGLVGAQPPGRWVLARAAPEQQRRQRQRDQRPARHAVASSQSSIRRRAMESTRGREKPRAWWSFSSARLNQRASLSSAGSMRISSLSPSA